MVIVWTLNAQEDLRSIYNFYLTKNQKVAIDIRKDILNTVKRLCYFPQMAQIELLLSDKSFIYRFTSVH
jgi:plasmid stabilization system protein ParE